MSRPNKATLRPSGTQNHRTRQQAHTRGVSTQASKPGQRGGGTTLSHHPKQARQHQSTQTPKGEHAPRVNTKPSHPQANTPTTSLLFHHPREHKKRPHSSVWAQPSVSARRGNRGKAGDRHERSADTRRGHADSAHTKSANNLVCAVCRLRPQGRIAREKAAHNSPRQSAWVVVFVGVFADVCRRFWDGWFGGLGVFWGCLACFLVF